jgi:hypothetical protein
MGQEVVKCLELVHQVTLECPVLFVFKNIDTALSAYLCIIGTTFVAASLGCLSLHMVQSVVCQKVGERVNCQFWL